MLVCSILFPLECVVTLLWKQGMALTWACWVADGRMQSIIEMSGCVLRSSASLSLQCFNS